MIITRPGRGTFVRNLSPKTVENLKLTEIKKHLEDAVRCAAHLNVPAEQFRELLEKTIKAEVLEDE